MQCFTAVAINYFFTGFFAGAGFFAGSGFFGAAHPPQDLQSCPITKPP